MFDGLSEEEFAEELRAAESAATCLLRRSGCRASTRAGPSSRARAGPAPPAEPLPIAADVDTRVIQAMKAQRQGINKHAAPDQDRPHERQKESGVEAVSDGRQGAAEDVEDAPGRSIGRRPRRAASPSARPRRRSLR